MGEREPWRLTEQQRQEIQEQLDSDEERRSVRRASLRTFAVQVFAQALGTVIGGLALTLGAVLVGVIKNIGPKGIAFIVVLLVGAAIVLIWLAKQPPMTVDTYERLRRQLYGERKGYAERLSTEG